MMILIFRDDSHQRDGRQSQTPCRGRASRIANLCVDRRVAQTAQLVICKTTRRSERKEAQSLNFQAYLYPPHIIPSTPVPIQESTYPHCPQRIPRPDTISQISQSSNALRTPCQGSTPNSSRRNRITTESLFLLRGEGIHWPGPGRRDTTTLPVRRYPTSIGKTRTPHNRPSCINAQIRGMSSSMTLWTQLTCRRRNGPCRSLLQVPSLVRKAMWPLAIPSDHTSALFTCLGAFHTRRPREQAAHRSCSSQPPPWTRASKARAALAPKLAEATGQGMDARCRTGTSKIPSIPRSNTQTSPCVWIAS